MSLSSAAEMMWGLQCKLTCLESTRVSIDVRMCMNLEFDPISDQGENSDLNGANVSEITRDK